MKAMVLAAGKGTRLFPLTGEIPKPLAPVVDTPIISHIFSLLSRHGLDEAHVNVNYLADTLIEAFGEESDTDGLHVSLSREDELLGTAGGVKRLENRFEGETFVVVSGDALTDVDLTKLVEFHKENGALATIALRRVYDTQEFGVVEIDEEHNILGFQEKPELQEANSTLANTGIYVFEPRVLDYIPEGEFYRLRQRRFPQATGERGEVLRLPGRVLLVGHRDARSLPPGAVRRALGQGGRPGARGEAGREPVGRPGRPDTLRGRR